jgi:dihydroxyacetone kinase-like predicted kinase
MAEAATSLLAGAVTYAARSIDEPVRLVQGQPFALLESEIVVAAEALDDALCLLVGKMLERVPSASLLTLYQGADVVAQASDATIERIRQVVPAMIEVELVIGGQPHYPWEVSLE